MSEKCRSIPDNIFSGSIYTPGDSGFAGNKKRKNGPNPYSNSRAGDLPFLEQLPARIFKPTEIAAILSHQRANWKLAKSTTVRNFISFLSESGKLMPYDFPFPYRPEFRYTWRQVPLLEILLTLKQGANFSHYTAMRLHRLTDQLPATIYLNHEQRPQPKNPYLEQGSIDAAFKRRPRESQNAIEFGGIRICITNGMHTNRLGVVEENLTYDGSAKVRVKVTSIERTLSTSPYARFMQAA